MPRKIPLPRGWNRRTKAAILSILALSHYTCTFTALVAATWGAIFATTPRRVAWEPAAERFPTPPGRAAAEPRPAPE